MIKAVRGQNQRVIMVWYRARGLPLARQKKFTCVLWIDTVDGGPMTPAGAAMRAKRPLSTVHVTE